MAQLLMGSGFSNFSNVAVVMLFSEVICISMLGLKFTKMQKFGADILDKCPWIMVL